MLIKVILEELTCFTQLLKFSQGIALCSFIDQALQAGESWDLAVIDPPTYSNSKRTDEDWNVQQDHVPLLRKVAPLIRPDGVVYFSTNFRRFKFDETQFPEFSCREISAQTVPEDFRNRRIHRCWKLIRRGDA